MALPTDPVGEVIELGIDDFARARVGADLEQSLSIYKPIRCLISCRTEWQALPPNG
jgi:hypothetical protein